MDIDYNIVDTDIIVQLCQAHHSSAFDHLKLIPSDSDVWEKLTAVIRAKEILQRDVLRLILKQRPSFLQAELLQVIQMYSKLVMEPKNSAQNSNRKSESKAFVHDEYSSSNILWKNSRIPDAVANDYELFKVCCNTFFDLFVDCNFSRLLYVLMTGFYRRLLAVSAVGLLHYISPSFTVLVEELTVIEMVNCSQISETIVKSLDEELRRLLIEETMPGPSLLAVFSVYPRSFLLLKDSQVFRYFFNKLRFHRKYQVQI